MSDFGLSAHMSAGETCVEISQGTEAYLPLEVFENLAVTEASDIYALGLLMWEAYYGIFWFSVWDAEKKRRRCAHPMQTTAAAHHAHEKPSVRRIHEAFHDVSLTVICVVSSC